MSPHHQALKSRILSCKGSKLNTNCECITFPRWQQPVFAGSHLDAVSKELRFLLRFKLRNMFLSLKLTNRNTEPTPKPHTAPSLSPPLLQASVNLFGNVERVQEYWRRSAMPEEQQMIAIFTQN